MLGLCIRIMLLIICQRTCRNKVSERDEEILTLGGLLDR